MTTEMENQIQADQVRVLAAALTRLHQRLRPADVLVVPAGENVWTLTVPSAAPGVMWRGGFVNGLEGWFCRVDPADPETPLEARRITPLPILDASPPPPVFNVPAVTAATVAHIETIAKLAAEVRRTGKDIKETDAADLVHWHPKIENLDWLADKDSVRDPRVDLYFMARDALAARHAVRDFLRSLDAGRAHLTTTRPALRAAVTAAARPTGQTRADAPAFSLGVRQVPKLSDTEQAHDQIGALLDDLNDAIEEGIANLKKYQYEEAADRRVRTARALVAEGAEAIRDAHRKILLATIERLKLPMAAEQMLEDE